MPNVIWNHFCRIWMKIVAVGPQLTCRGNPHVFGLRRKPGLIRVKMQKIIEQRSPSRQFFETVNFAFMKKFDFLVKITIFWAFLLFLGWFVSQITAENRARWLYDLLNYLATELDFGHNLWHKSPRKKQKGPKKGYFD